MRKLTKHIHPAALVMLISIAVMTVAVSMISLPPDSPIVLQFAAWILLGLSVGGLLAGFVYGLVAPEKEAAARLIYGKKNKDLKHTSKTL